MRLAINEVCEVAFELVVFLNFSLADAASRSERVGNRMKQYQSYTVDVVPWSSSVPLECGKSSSECEIERYPGNRQGSGSLDTPISLLQLACKVVPRKRRHN
ncbi:hypothetical protein KIN20_010745 [Parelaphostrongylus tenuis]|nr:hypothetical protein KIN20_010745 [Parelaphostrongylus tenuis]